MISAKHKTSASGQKIGLDEKEKVCRIVKLSWGKLLNEKAL